MISVTFNPSLFFCVMRDRWTPFVLQAEDDWTAVSNRQNRKTIQNRLAQRARSECIIPNMTEWSTDGTEQELLSRRERKGKTQTWMVSHR